MTPRGPAKAWRALPAGIWTLGFGSLFMDISSELIHSLLPVFMVTTLGASMVAVGFIEGVAEATAAVTKVFSGALSDYLGKRKFLLVLGYALAAFTKPMAAARLSSLLDEKRIELVTEFATGEVDGRKGRLVSYDEREVPFDLLVTVPLHGGAPYVARSPGLGDELGFVQTDPFTLQARAASNVFAIGDAANLPTSKAGSVTHFEADILTENIDRFLRGRPLTGAFDGHANCFVETGFKKALLIDFNYETEPLPGRFPGHAGPLPLLAESRLNHLGKLMFQWFYWHVLLPGRDLPGIPTQMSMAGKRPPAAPIQEVRQ